MPLQFKSLSPPAKTAEIKGALHQDLWIEHVLKCQACSHCFSDTPEAYAAHKKWCRELWRISTSHPYGDCILESDEWFDDSFVRCKACLEPFPPYQLRLHKKLCEIRTQMEASGMPPPDPPRKTREEYIHQDPWLVPSARCRWCRKTFACTEYLTHGEACYKENSGKTKLDSQALQPWLDSMDWSMESSQYHCLACSKPFRERNVLGHSRMCQKRQDITQALRCA